MDQNKFDDAKNLLEKEIDELDNPDKKERMKFFLNEYSKPKFNINASLLVFLVTLILCLLWQNNEQRVFIDKQQQEVKVTTKTDISIIEDIFSPLVLIKK